MSRGSVKQDRKERDGYGYGPRSIGWDQGGAFRERSGEEEYIITRGSVLTMQESRAVTVVRPNPFSTRRPRLYVPTLSSWI